MNTDIISARLSSYRCKSPLEEDQALKEISQEIILMGLSRHNFFSAAEFHGGTALRILYDLPRFSEDLDFALLKPDTSFSLTPYLKKVSDELRAFGYDFEIKDRSKAENAVKKAFLKDDSIGKLLTLKRSGLPKKITIKLEVDSNPPFGAETEIKYLDFPSPFGIKVKNLSSSFSGKLHALLCRNYIKGRDWYDFIWYVSRKISPNFLLLKNALEQNGPWEGKNINTSAPWLIQALYEKIEQIHWQDATRDVAAFIQAYEQDSLKIWGKDFFRAEVEKMERYLLQETF